MLMGPCKEIECWRFELIKPKLYGKNRSIANLLSRYYSVLFWSHRDVSNFFWIFLKIFTSLKNRLSFLCNLRAWFHGPAGSVFPRSRHFCLSHYFFLVCRNKNQLRDYMTTEPARLAGILASVLIKNYPVDNVNRPSDNRGQKYCYLPSFDFKTSSRKEMVKMGNVIN